MDGYHTMIKMPEASKTNQGLNQSPGGHTTINGYPLRLSSGGLKVPILIEELKVFEKGLNEFMPMALT